MKTKKTIARKTNHNLNELIKDYIESKGKGLEELKKFYAIPKNEELLIMLACLSIDSSGKKHSHQKRIEPKSLIDAGNLLLQFANEIKEFKDFESLHEFIVNKTKEIKKFGELCSYDTALRISFNLNILPTKVYLHAGAKEGAKNLKWEIKTKIIETCEIPEIHNMLNILEPYEIENFLCIYEEELKTINQ